MVNFLANCNEKNECEIVDEKACETEICEDNLIDYALDNDSSELNYLFLANCDNEQNCQIVPDTECSKIECRDNLMEYLLKRANIEIPTTKLTGANATNLRKVGERISFTYKPSRREKAKEYMKHVKQNLKEANLKIAQSTEKLKVSGELRKLRTKKSLAAPKALENYYSLRRIAFDKSKIDNWIDQCKDQGCIDVKLTIVGFANPDMATSFRQRKISRRNISTRFHRTQRNVKNCNENQIVFTHISLGDRIRTNVMVMNSMTQFGMALGLGRKAQLVVFQLL